MSKKILCYSVIGLFSLLIVWISIFDIIDLVNHTVEKNFLFFLYELVRFILFLIPIISSILTLKNTKHKIFIAIFCLVDNLLILILCIYLWIHHIQKYFWSYITIPYIILLTLASIFFLSFNIYLIFNHKSSQSTSIN